MKRRSPKTLPTRLVEGRRQLEQWRRKRKKGRSPIPESLWEMAVNLAQEYGLSKTAGALNLDYNRLKMRMETSVSDEKQPEPTQMGFVELVASSLPASAECIVELESVRGARMRIQLSGAGPPDLAALTRAFLQGES